MTKIFLDSGDPAETNDIINRIGFLGGQTTNPTLISRNPEVQKYIAQGKKFTKAEILKSYRDVVTELSKMMPGGSISIEVYADENTTSDEMLEQGREMFRWIPNAQIKYPTTHAGLMAAEKAVTEKMRVNMTLCFSQEQAAAVYSATRGVPFCPAQQGAPFCHPRESGDPQSVAKKSNVFVSPFVGRLDDIGINGMDLIKNTIEMYKSGDGHVEVLTASVRSLDHFLFALALGSDIITAPYKILKEWAEKGMPQPRHDFRYERPDLKPIPYLKLDLNQDWQKFNLNHELTTKGIQKFSEDWNALVAN